MLFDDAKPVKKELDESDNTEQKNNEPNNNK